MPVNKNLSKRFRLTFFRFSAIITAVMTMKPEMKARISADIASFRLPRYSEIPSVGLYLEQACKYMGEFLTPLGDYALTPSMVSNYVKRHLIDSPVKKQYSRDQLAYLLFIAVAKNVLSLDALADFIRLQQRTYELPRAYDYFCQQFEWMLKFCFELTDTIEDLGADSTDEKRLLSTCVAAVVQKVYLEKCLAEITKEE